MKKTILAISLLMSTGAFAQKFEQGLEKIIVEKYYVANAADSVQADLDIDDANANNSTTIPHGALHVGAITYRVYADMLPGYRIKLVLGNTLREHPLYFHTTTSFYNHPLGDVIQATAKTDITTSPLLALDSYLTFGSATKDYSGIFKEDDNTTGNFFTSSTPGGVLLNNVPNIMGVPLTQKDGYFSKKGQSSIQLSIDQAAQDIFKDGTVIGDAFEISDGGWFSTTGSVWADSLTNRVLIAQVTTDGKLTFKLNVLITPPDGKGQYYVSNNPLPSDSPDLTEDDVYMPSLIYPDTTVITNIPVAIPASDVLVSMYPNPTKDQLTVEIANAQPNSKGSYTIYGIVGNVIAHKELNAITTGYKETIDMSSFAQGLYSIQLNVNGAAITKKIIKN